MTNQKGIAPLIIVLVIAILGGSAYLTFRLGFKDQTNSNLKKTTQIKPSSSPEPIATPIPKGSLSGKIIGGYYSRPVNNVEITIKNDVFEKKFFSNQEGNFSQDEIPPGLYTLTFLHPEYVFIEQKIEIKEGRNILEKSIFGNLKNPKPTTLNGLIFVDRNSNGVKDGDDGALDASLSIYEKSSGTLATVARANSLGNFSSQITKIGVYTIEPGGYTFYGKPGNKELIVDGYGGTKTLNFGYIPLQVEAGFTIYVFNDKNENGSKESDEEYIHYQYVKVANLTGIITEPLGNTYNTAVGVEGSSTNQFEPGTYKFEMIPEDSSWDYYYKITKREQTLNFTQTTSHQTIYLGAHKLY